MSTRMADVYTLVLRPGTVQAEFERFVREEGFPLAKVTRAGTIERQRLLREQEGGAPAQYVWVVEWTLHFGPDSLEMIGPSLWALEQRLDALCERRAFTRHVDAGAWPLPAET